MTSRQPPIEIVFAGWLDAMRRGDVAAMEGRLAPDVVHQGIRPEMVCHGRAQVLAQAGRRAGRLPPVEALELVAAGDNVVMSVRGPGIGVPLDPDGDPRGQTTVVFTLRDGLIARMQDYVHRADALEVAGASADWE